MAFRRYPSGDGTRESHPRTRAVPRCGVDRAFEEAATILMSVEAFKRDRKVRWDPVKEEIV